MPENPFLKYRKDISATPIAPVPIIELGNIDLKNRPRVKLPSGKTATVRSKSFGFDGQEVLLPTVSDDGRILSDKEAVDLYRKTGRHLGKFSSVEEANKYAEQLHREQEELIKTPSADYWRNRRNELLTSQPRRKLPQFQTTLEKLKAPGPVARPVEPPETKLKKRVAKEVVEKVLTPLAEGTLKDIEIVFSPLTATIEYARHTGLGGQSWRIGLAAATREMIKPWASIFPAHEQIERDTRWIEELKSARRIPQILKDRGWPGWVSEYVGETGEFVPYMINPAMAYGVMSKSGQTLLRGSKLYKNLLKTALEKGDTFTARKINTLVRDISRYKNQAERLATRGITPKGLPLRTQAGLPLPKKQTVYKGTGGGGTTKLIGEGGVLGDAEYYAFTEGVARKYGKNVAKQTVELKNPLYLTNDRQLAELTQKAGLEYRVPSTRAESEQLTKYIQTLGHDGVIVKIPKKGKIVNELEGKRLWRLFTDDQVIKFKPTAKAPQIKPLPPIKTPTEALVRPVVPPGAELPPGTTAEMLRLRALSTPEGEKFLAQKAREQTEKLVKYEAERLDKIRAARKPKGRVEEIKEFFTKQPKPSEPAKELSAVNRKIAQRTSRIAEEQYNDSIQFIKQVQEKGGIRPFAKGVEFEEYQRAVPAYLKKGKGLPPDEMADVLGLETTQGLYDRLAQLPQKMPQRGDFLESAKSLVEIYDTPLIERKRALEAMVKAGLGGDLSKMPISSISKRLTKVLGKEITPEQAAAYTRQADRLDIELAEVAARWRAGLATPEQKIEALRLKGSRQLKDAEYRRLMQSSTGKATMSMNARNPVTKEQAQGFIDYLKEIPELATPAQKRAIINIMGRKKLTPAQVRSLERIFKIRTPKEPLSMAAAEDLIAATQKVPPTRGGQPPVVPAELATIPDDIYEIKELALKPFATPTPFTFTKLGPEAKKYFQYPILDAEQRAFRASAAKLAERKAITKGLGTSSSKKIGLYNLGQNPKSAKVLEKMGIKIPTELSPKELRASEWFKKEFDTYHASLNQARVEIGYAPIPYEENYFTMIRQRSFMNELGWDMMKKDMPDMMAKNIHLNAPSFWATKRRLGGLKAIETDAFPIFDKYAKRANEHIQLAKPIRRGRILLKAIESTKPKTHAFLTNYLDFVAGKPLATTGSDALDWGLTKLRKNIAFGMLSYSLNSASVQATALVQSTAITGPKSLAIGIGRYFKDFGKRAYQQSSVLDVRSMETALIEMTEGIVGGVRKGLKTFGEAGIAPLQFIDKQTAAISWYAFESHGIKSGLRGKELIRFADEWVLKTQASAQRSVIAPIQRSQVGRTVTLFNTFVLSEWNTFWREYMGFGTRQVLSKETLRRMTNFMVGAMVTNMLYEDVLGRPSPFPRPIKTLLDELKKKSSFWQIAWEEGKELATQIPVVGGSVRFESELGGAVVQTLQELVSIAAGKRLRGVPALETLGKVFGIGGTSQIKKISRGISREDRQFPYTTEERIRMVAWGSDWKKIGYLRRSRWDLRRRIRKLDLEIGNLGRAGKDSTKQRTTRVKSKTALSGIEKELGDLIRKTPKSADNPFIKRQVSPDNPFIRKAQ